MQSPLFLVTGFGPFVGVDDNPSQVVARALESDPPEGVEVRAEVLTVSIERCARELDAALARLPRPPAGLLCLGVHPGETFRLERRARALLRSIKPDVDGVVAEGVHLDGADELWTSLALTDLADALRASGATAVEISDDAGGYVCERIYHHALGRAAELGVPALFLHVPPTATLAPERQVGPVRALLARLAHR